VTANTGGTAPSLTSATASGGAPSATWTVSASTAGTTGQNNGSIRLDLTSKGTIQDQAGQGLAGTPPFTGEAYTYDTTAPTPTLSCTPSASPSNSTTFNCSASFSESVTGFDSTSNDTTIGSSCAWSAS